MKPEDMVYSAIYNGAIKAGASKEQALYQADLGLDMYKKSMFPKKTIDLIEDRIKEAKLLSAIKQEKEKS